MQLFTSNSHFITSHSHKLCIQKKKAAWWGYGQDFWHHGDQILTTQQTEQLGGSHITHNTHKHTQTHQLCADSIPVGHHWLRRYTNIQILLHTANCVCVCVIPDKDGGNSQALKWVFTNTWSELSWWSWETRKCQPNVYLSITEKSLWSSFDLVLEDFIKPQSFFDLNLVVCLMTSLLKAA